MQSSATSTECAWHPARHRAKLPLPSSPWQGSTDGGIAMHHPPGWPHLSAALCRRAAAPATRGQAMEVPSMGPYLRGDRQAVHSAQLLLSRCRLHRRQLRQGRQAGARRHHPDGWSLRPAAAPASPAVIRRAQDLLARRQQVHSAAPAVGELGGLVGGARGAHNHDVGHPAGWPRQAAGWVRSGGHPGTGSSANSQ